MKGQREIEAYYEGYDEWHRLERHKMEFELTRRYLDKYLPPKARVYDIGGGPGRYALYLAGQGHRVTLLDLSPKHIQVAREKAAEAGVTLEAAIVGNALQLPEEGAQAYDVVLLMGPLYHLVEERDRRQAIVQALEKLKPGGVLVVAFIAAYAPLLDALIHAPEALEQPDSLLKFLDRGTYLDAETGEFTTAYFITPTEARKLMGEFELEPCAFAAVDSIGSLLENRLNSVEPECFQKWMEVFFRLAEDPHVWGAAHHYLYIGKKK